jgi:hypothetical protein
MKTLNPTNTNCQQVAQNQVNCDLVPGEIGTGVPPGVVLTFTNRTGAQLQVNQADAITNERTYWSEWCVYTGPTTDSLKTSQGPAGVGEVGCSTKQPGEDYAPIRWGAGTGLAVAPGEMVIVNSHTEPAAVNHTYALTVAPQTTGLYSWRQPQVDEVITCNGETQSTAGSPWHNDTGRELHLTGASIYAEAGGGPTPNTMSGAACIYVMTADGAVKYQNCDNAIRTRGEVTFPLVTVAPGEYVAAQATNACAAPGVWDWVAFLRVW